MSLTKLIASKWLLTRRNQVKVLSSFAPSAGCKLVRKRTRPERDNIIQQCRIFCPLTSSYFAVLLPWLYISTMTKEWFFSFGTFPRVRTRPISAWYSPNRSSRVLSAAVSVSQVYRPRRLGTNGCKLREWKGVLTWKHYRVEGSFPS